MFQGPSNLHAFVVRCKKCGQNIPASVETLPSSWVVVRCPLCGEVRRYLSTEVFQGKVSHQAARKRARSDSEQ
jgi:RNase P subunit RPR2